MGDARCDGAKTFPQLKVRGRKWFADGLTRSSDLDTETDSILVDWRSARVILLRNRGWQPTRRDDMLLSGWLALDKRQTVESSALDIDLFRQRECDRWYSK